MARSSSYLKKGKITATAAYSPTRRTKKVSPKVHYYETAKKKEDATTLTDSETRTMQAVMHNFQSEYEALENQFSALKESHKAALNFSNNYGSLNKPLSELGNSIRYIDSTFTIISKEMKELTQAFSPLKPLHIEAVMKLMEKSIKISNLLSSQGMIKIYKQIDEFVNTRYIMPSTDGTEREFVLIASGDVVDDEEPSFK